MQNLTEGFVPTHIARTLGAAGQAKRLVEVGLWLVADGGYQFHQFNHRQMSAAEVLDRRRKRAEAGRKGGKASGVSRNGAKGEANDEASASAKLDQNLTPVPVPVPSVGYLGGEGTSVTASEPPPRFCPDHPNDTDEKCFACGQFRRTHPERLAKWKVDRKAAAAQARQAAIDACNHCDEFGDVTFDDAVRKCNHQQEAVNG